MPETLAVRPGERRGERIRRLRSLSRRRGARANSARPCRIHEADL